jgi:hypothetical protein
VSDTIDEQRNRRYTNAYFFRGDNIIEVLDFMTTNNIYFYPGWRRLPTGFEIKYDNFDFKKPVDNSNFSVTAYFSDDFYIEMTAVKNNCLYLYNLLTDRLIEQKP